MADSSEMSSLKVSMNYTALNTLKLRTNVHTNDGGPTIRDGECFSHGSVLELYEGSI